MQASQAIERSLEFDDATLARELFGPGNAHLDALAAKAGVELHSRGLAVTVRASSEALADSVANCLVQLYSLLKVGHPVHRRDYGFAWDTLFKSPDTDLVRLFRDAVYIASPRKTVAPKTLNQRAYVQTLQEHDMVFAIGPAGTGKTYLAVAMAVAALTRKEIRRLVLTRPAVEAGERLGFLPGDLVEKINPYLRPLYDALHDMIDARKVQEMLETGVIEIAPLAFMRGRTLNDSFIILDEAQNTTPEQMKMFLTRLGFGSKAVITGDVTQIDLPTTGPHRVRSGLVEAQKVLQGVPGVGFVQFAESDVIRHTLVARIVKAYEQYETSQARRQ